MNVPPPVPRTPLLTSLPRALPPQVSASSLASTLRQARRRRIRRRAGRTVGTVGVVALAWVLALWGTNDFPVTPALSGSQTAATGVSQQGQVAGQGPARTVVHAPAAEPGSAPGLAASGYPLPISSHPPVPAERPSTSPETPPASFLLVRSQSAQTVRTTPLPPAVSSAGSRPSFSLVATASVPAPMVITTRRVIAPQSIATADQPSTPGPATDADLFAHADGRPAALCRLNSGGTRWFWLDQAATGRF